MVKYKQLYHNRKDKIVDEKNFILIFFRKIVGKKVLVKNIIKKGGNVNGIKDSENGIP